LVGDFGVIVVNIDGGEAGGGRDVNSNNTVVTTVVDGGQVEGMHDDVVVPLLYLESRMSESNSFLGDDERITL